HTYNYHREIEGRPALTVMPENEIKNDFARFGILLSRVGIHNPYAMAYPYGAYSQAAINAATGEGYSIGFTITKGYVRGGDPVMALNRFGIGPDVSLDTFANIVSGNAQ
ncbi:MAG: polysaccharide deacetylase family protein, partial [Desulfocucumaceae bacterium]